VVRRTRGLCFSKVAFERAEKQPLRWRLFFDGERLTSTLTFGDPAGPFVWKPGPDFSVTGLTPSDSSCTYTPLRQVPGLRTPYLSCSITTHVNETRFS
jgi:hypothetical protein